MLDPKNKLQLSQPQQTSLLKFARDSIGARLEKVDLPVFSDPAEVFQHKCGTFVTLTKAGILRGCIGAIQPKLPLCRAVQEAALSAAFEDPRFPSLDIAELPAVAIEISVISSLHRIDSVKEIEIRTHGLFVRLGELHGVLLPQVAAKNNWNRETFLEHVCVKAGLDKQAWQNPDMKIMVFNAQIFHE